MQNISVPEFEKICNAAETKTLRYSNQLPKICVTPTHIIKFFLRKKRWFSSDRLKPRALRFIQNCEYLKIKGYNVPEITQTQYCEDLKIHLIHYFKIEGFDIRHLVNQGRESLLFQVVDLIAHLHAKGIFFRSIHLENLLLQENGDIALIDISDVRFKRSPLSLLLCYRNLKHLFLVKEDKAIWQQFGINKFLTIYFHKSQLADWQQKLLRHCFNSKAFC